MFIYSHLLYQMFTGFVFQSLVWRLVGVALEITATFCSCRLERKVIGGALC